MAKTIKDFDKAIETATQRWEKLRAEMNQLSDTMLAQHCPNDEYIRCNNLWLDLYDEKMAANRVLIRAEKARTKYVAAIKAEYRAIFS